MPKRKCTFKDEYLTNKGVKRSKKGNEWFYCELCGYDISLAHGGQADINDHLKSKKHQTNLKAAQSTASVLSFMPSQSAPTLKGPGEMIKIPVIFKKRPGFLERSSGSPA